MSKAFGQLQRIFGRDAVFDAWDDQGRPCYQLSFSNAVPLYVRNAIRAFKEKIECNDSSGSFIESKENPGTIAVLMRKVDMEQENVISALKHYERSDFGLITKAESDLQQHIVAEFKRILGDDAVQANLELYTLTVSGIDVASFKQWGDNLERLLGVDGKSISTDTSGVGCLRFAAAALTTPEVLAKLQDMHRHKDGSLYCGKNPDLEFVPVIRTVLNGIAPEKLQWRFVENLEGGPAFQTMRKIPNPRAIETAIVNRLYDMEGSAPKEPRASEFATISLAALTKTYGRLRDFKLENEVIVAASLGTGGLAAS